jgi:hypothetical protein
MECLTEEVEQKEVSNKNGVLVKAHGMIKNDDLRDDALNNFS